MNQLSTLVCLGVLAAGSTSALAQSFDISPVNKFAWGENIGWTNWNDSNPLSEKVVVGETYMKGLIWGENVGWINTGNVPSNGVSYNNLTGLDYGVNVSPSGALSGKAWGENIGWLNFTLSGIIPAGQLPRFVRVEGRFRGYVWGENVGWINLDDATHFVGVICPADFDDDGTVDFFDYDAFVQCFEGGACPPGKTADFDGDGTVDFFDYDAFVVAFEAGC